MPETDPVQVPQANTIQWDTETREDLAAREGHIRDEIMYLTYGLLSWMESEWGGVVTHVKTSTDPATGEVAVVKASKDELGAVYLRRLGSQNIGQFSFWRPLHKLSLKVPPKRQFHVTPFTRKVEGLGTLFIFPMNKRTSMPRNRKEEKMVAEAAQQVVEEIAPTEE